MQDRFMEEGIDMKKGINLRLPHNLAKRKNRFGNLIFKLSIVIYYHYTSAPLSVKRILK